MALFLMSNVKIPAYRQAGKYQNKSKVQIPNPPTTPLLKGGKGGLLIDF